MVPEALLRRRAAQLGVGLSAIVRELAVLHSLELLQENNHAWVLRGGTALAYGYFGVHRLSEDLDLTTPGEPGDVDDLLAELCIGLSDRLETQVVAKPPPVPLPGPDLRRVDLSWGESHRLQIDFSWHEATVRIPQLREIVMPYPGLRAFISPMWALEELMANKWFILDERAEPRDLFDLWVGLTGFHVEWDAVVRCHQDRYGFVPIPGNLGRTGLRTNWELRLSHQIRDLPAFHTVARELRWHVRLEQGD
jgi:predicted nucleotidyltransferase component of viral defense system